MKDEIISTTILLAFILLQFALIFGLWGGRPEGAFVKIEKLEYRIKQLEARIIGPDEYE